MKESNMPKADFIVSILLTIFGIWVFVQSVRMPRFEAIGADPYSVPGIVPGLLGIVIAILGSALFYRSILRKGYQLGLSWKKVSVFLADESSRNILWTILLSIFYSFFMLGRIPFELATGIFFCAFVMVFTYKIREGFVSQRRTVLFVLIMGAVVSGAVTFIFRNIFYVGLP